MVRLRGYTASGRRAICVVVFALVAGALVAAIDPSPLSAQSGVPARVSSGEAKEPNSRIVTDAKGQRVVEMRWAPGRTGTVLKLRIPANYIWPGGGGFAAALGPSYPDPNVVRPYMDTFILEALLPDFEPKTPQNAERFKDGISGETVKIGVMAASPIARDGGPFIDSYFRALLPTVHTPYHERQFRMHLATKPDRFGLKHMGPAGDFERFRTFGSVDDIYFPEQDPKDVFMKCGAEEIRDLTEDPSWKARPICQHWFYSATLGAVVDLTYRRIHLKDWRELQGRAERLFATFEIIEPNGGKDGVSEQQ